MQKPTLKMKKKARNPLALEPDHPPTHLAPGMEGAWPSCVFCPQAGAVPSNVATSTPAPSNALRYLDGLSREWTNGPVSTARAERSDMLGTPSGDARRSGGGPLFAMFESM